MLSAITLHHLQQGEAASLCSQTKACPSRRCAQNYNSANKRVFFLLFVAAGALPCGRVKQLGNQNLSSFHKGIFKFRHPLRQPCRFEKSFLYFSKTTNHTETIKLRVENSLQPVGSNKLALPEKKAATGSSGAKHQS